MTGKFPAQMASNAENVSIWWRHHALIHLILCQVLVVERFRWVSVKWVRYIAGNRLPQGAVIAGHSENGYSLYPVSVKVFSSSVDKYVKLRGSFDTRHKYAEFYNRGRAESSASWEILVLKYSEYRVPLM